MSTGSILVHDFVHDGFGVSLELDDESVTAETAEIRWKEIYDLRGKEIVDYSAGKGLVIFWSKFEEARKEEPYESSPRYLSFVEILIGLEAVSLSTIRRNYLDNRRTQYFTIVDSSGSSVGPKLNGQPLFFYPFPAAKCYARAVGLKEGFKVVVADKAGKMKEDTS